MGAVQRVISRQGGRGMGGKWVGGGWVGAGGLILLLTLYYIKKTSIKHY